MNIGLDKISIRNVMIKNKKSSNKTIPFLITPIVMFDIYNTNTRNLLDKLQDYNIKIPKNLSVNPISNSGLDEASKGKLRREIENAYKNNIIDNKTRNKLIYDVNFTGNTNSDAVTVEELKYYDTDIENIDVVMPTELQEYYETPFEALPNDLMQSITEYSSGLLKEGDDIFSSLKQFVKEIGDLIG